MKKILISVRPEYCYKILTKEKILEIRKTIPKCDLPCEVYIYCTKGKDLWKHNQDVIVLGDTDLTSYYLNGKVIAKFTLNKIDFLIDVGFGIHYVDKNLNDLDLDYLRTNSCLTDEQIYMYLGLKKDRGYYNDGYAWHIDDLISYDKPKELSEFSSIMKRMKGKESRFTSHLLQRPPQSWCYVEVNE